MSWCRVFANGVAWKPWTRCSRIGMCSSCSIARRSTSMTSRLLPIGPGLDGFGLQPLEAIVCGCAVFTTVSGGPCDYLDPGVNCSQISGDSDRDLAAILSSVSTHMKLQVQPWPNAAGFLLSVNTHDQVLGARPERGRRRPPSARSRPRTSGSRRRSSRPGTTRACRPSCAILRDYIDDPPADGRRPGRRPPAQPARAFGRESRPETRRGRVKPKVEPALGRARDLDRAAVQLDEAS